jgi:hypothetical protein
MGLAGRIVTVIQCSRPQMRIVLAFQHWPKGGHFVLISCFLFPVAGLFEPGKTHHFVARAASHRLPAGQSEYHWALARGFNAAIIQCQLFRSLILARREFRV